MRIRRFLFAMLFALITISSIFAFNAGTSGESKTVQAATRAEKIALATKRAEYMAKYRWTAKATVTGWRKNYNFTKGNKYTIPYSQCVSGKYLFYDVTLAQFEAAVADTSSDLYGTWYDNSKEKYMPKYGMDCSSFVSFVIGWPGSGPLKTYTIAPKAQDKKDGFYYKTWDTVAAGDLLNTDGSHVIYVKGVSGNNIITIEQTTNKGIDTVERTRTKSALSSYRVVGYDYRGTGAKYDDVTAKLGGVSGGTTPSGATVVGAPSWGFKYAGKVEYINGVGPNDSSSPYTNLLGYRTPDHSASWTDAQKLAGLTPAVLDGTSLYTVNNKITFSGWAFVNGGQKKIIYSVDKNNWYDCASGTYSSADTAASDFVVNNNYISSLVKTKAAFSVTIDLSQYAGKTGTIHLAVVGELSDGPFHFLTVSNLTVKDKGAVTPSTPSTPSVPADTSAVISASPSWGYKYVGNIDYINGVGPNGDSTKYSGLVGNRDINHDKDWTDAQKLAGIQPANLLGSTLYTVNNVITISGCAFVNGGQTKIVWSVDKYNWFDCTGGSYSSAGDDLVNYVVGQSYVSSSQAFKSNALFTNVGANLTKYAGQTVDVHFAVVPDLEDVPMHFFTIVNLKVAEKAQSTVTSSSSQAPQNSTSSSQAPQNSSSSSVVEQTSSSSSIVVEIPQNSTSVEDIVIETSSTQIINPNPSIDVETEEILGKREPGETEMQASGCGGNISTGIYLIPLILLPLCMLRSKERKN